MVLVSVWVVVLVLVGWLVLGGEHCEVLVLHPSGVFRHKGSEPFTISEPSTPVPRLTVHAVSTAKRRDKDRAKDTE